MNAYIVEYVDFMKNTCHKSENTVESYKSDVMQYIAYLKELGISELISTTKTTVLSYMLDLKKRGRASSTLSRTLASIRSYYLYLLNNGYVKSDPTAALASPKVEKKPPSVLSGT